MREYRFQATDDTIESLRRLRGRWTGFVASELSFAVSLEDGSTVRVQVDAADVEDAFEAFRLEAFVDPTPEPLTDAIPETAGDFAEGGNDIVLFTGATWSEPGAALAGDAAAETSSSTSSMHFSGHPGQLPETADVVCITTDAIVVATTRGTGLLVRTGLKPYSLDVVRDAEAIAKFLRERGYAQE